MCSQKWSLGLEWDMFNSFILVVQRNTSRVHQSAHALYFWYSTSMITAYINLTSLWLFVNFTVGLQDTEWVWRRCNRVNLGLYSTVHLKKHAHGLRIDLFIVGAYTGWFYPYLLHYFSSVSTAALNKWSATNRMHAFLYVAQRTDMRELRYMQWWCLVYLWTCVSFQKSSE